MESNLLILCLNFFLRSLAMIQMKEEVTDFIFYTVFLQMAYIRTQALKYSYKHIYGQVHFRCLINAY